MSAKHDVTLRLIALFKLAKALLLVAVGIGALRLVHEDLTSLATDWADRLNLDPQHHHIDAVLAWLASLSPRTLASVGVGSFIYAILLLTEGIGLWMEQPWAEYFTIIMTTSFIPFEIYEVVRRLTTTRLIVVALNVVIVVYLVQRVRRRGQGAPVRYP
jgi:uncharacterized membrane protein (DUF2068 family)